MIVSQNYMFISQLNLFPYRLMFKQIFNFLNFRLPSNLTKYVSLLGGICVFYILVRRNLLLRSNILKLFLTHFYIKIFGNSMLY